MVNLLAQLLLGNFKIDWFSIKLMDVPQSCDPIDLDHVPLRVFEVEGQLDCVVEGILDRHPLFFDLPVAGEQVSKRRYSERCVRQRCVRDEDDVMVLFFRMAGDERERAIGRVQEEFCLTIFMPITSR